MDSAAVELEDVRAFSVREKLLAYVELTKPRIAFLLVLTSAAGFYLATKESFNTILFINSMIGITLLAFGVATLNQWVERDIDPLLARLPVERPGPTHCRLVRRPAAARLA